MLKLKCLCTTDQTSCLRTTPSWISLRMPRWHPFFCVNIVRVMTQQHELFCWTWSGQTHRMLEISVALHFAIWEGGNSSGRISLYLCVNRSFLRCLSWCTSGWQHGCSTFKAQYRTFRSQAHQGYRWGERLGLLMDSVAFNSEHFLNSHHSHRLPARTVELGTFQVVKSAKPTLYFRIYCHNSTHEIDSTSPIQWPFWEQEFFRTCFENCRRIERRR